MLRSGLRTILFSSAALMALIGCQSPISLRLPSSSQFEYDSGKVHLLKWAAQNRVLFQIQDPVFNDVASSQVQETCKTLKEPAWTQAVFNVLETMKKNSALQNKVHIVELKKGDSPNVEVSKDLDGLTYLIVSYSTTEKKSTITDVSQIPCDNKTTLYIGEQLTQTSFDLPSTANVSKMLKELPARTNPDRWNFNTEFLKALADKMTILKFSPDLGFEKTAEGQPFFAQFLNEQAEAIKSKKFQAFDYWLNEIAQRSHSGSYLKIMALIPDKQLSYGMGVTQNSKTLAYPFLSYKSQEGKFTYTSLGQLDQCLEELSAKYKRGLASIRSDYSTQADTFLYPGHICKKENP